MATYDERLAGLLAIGMPRRIAMVVAFRPELVSELGNAASIACLLYTSPSPRDS